ncbi:septation protein IspZ [Bradyrhizobium sp. SYSU BS000235]|uniref:septation protein IspZ n=1 Tax=Bradyrhizobium sp. SYSU BS000235 TaxID=3411332 RepID=UPI003C77FC2E
MFYLLRRLLVSFVSTIVFFAVYVAIGDVLLAAIAATATVIAQLVLGWTAYGSRGGMTWASFAVVLTLTGTTFAGDDPATSGNWISSQQLAPVNATCRPTLRHI